MLLRRLFFLQMPVRMAAFAGLLWMSSFSGFSDEPAQPAQAEKTEKPAAAPEKKNLLEFRAYRPPESFLGSQKINVPTPPVQVPLDQRTVRQNREQLDRQKNWVFALPDDDKNSGKAENIFDLDAGNSKSVLVRFLENKPKAKSTFSPDLNANGFNPNALRNFGAAQMPGLGSEKPKGLNAWDQPSMRPENSIGGSGAMLSLGERWQELSIPRSQKTPEEKQAEMKMFESLFVPQNNVVNNGGLTSLGNNFGSPMTAPVESRDLSAFKVTPSAPGGIGIPTTVLPGANPSAQPDVNTRAFGPSALPAPAPVPQRNVSQPLMLPIPKRHF